MDRRRVPARDRALELLLWAAALSAGGFVLLPAAIEWIQAHRLEAEESEKNQDQEQRSNEKGQELLHIVSDPATDERLRETPDEDFRTFSGPSSEGHPRPSRND